MSVVPTASFSIMINGLEVPCKMTPFPPFLGSDFNPLFIITGLHEVIYLLPGYMKLLL